MDAAQQAQKLQAEDFIDFKGEFMDGKPVEVAWITDDNANQ